MRLRSGMMTLIGHVMYQCRRCGDTHTLDMRAPSQQHAHFTVRALDRFSRKVDALNRMGWL